MESEPFRRKRRSSTIKNSPTLDSRCPEDKMESTGSLARKLKVSVQQSGHQMKVMGSIPAPFVTSSFLFLFHFKNGTSSSGQCRKCRNPF